MKQAFIYSSKVWLTAITLMAVSTMIFFTYHYETRPPGRHVIDDPGPILGTILLSILSLFFVPAWGVFCVCIRPVVRSVKGYYRQKLVLNSICIVLVLATFSPLFITHASDETYYPLAGCYLVFVSISVWLNKLKSIDELPHIQSPTIAE